MEHEELRAGTSFPRRGAAAPSSGRRPGNLRGPRAGLTLLEVVVSLSILVTALLGFTQVVIISMRAAQTDREVTLARQAARQVLETMQGAELSEVFALFNADPDDDPDGPGTAPGNRFAVAGLRPRVDDPVGMVGEIFFPTVDAGGVVQLREDVNDADLGMPRDLNGDGIIQPGVDVSGDYQILPVRVRLRWRGATGNSSFEFKTVLMDV